MSHAVIEFLDTPIRDLDISVRTSNCLRNSPPDGFGDDVTMRTIVTKSEAELMRLPNFGRKSLKELNEILAIHGLRVGMDLEHVEKTFPNSQFSVPENSDKMEVKTKYTEAQLKEWVFDIVAGDEKTLDLAIGGGLLKFITPIHQQAVARAVRDGTVLTVNRHAKLTLEYDVKAQKGTFKINLS